MPASLHTKRPVGFSTGGATPPSGGFFRAEDKENSGCYATPADIDDLSIPQNARGDYELKWKWDFLRVATSRVNSVLGQRWTVPLQVWSPTLVWATCEIAYALMVRGKRGVKPGSDEWRVLKDRYEDAVQLIASAQDYEITLDPRLVCAEPEPIAVAYSDRPRGWGRSNPYEEGSYDWP